MTVVSMVALPKEPTYTRVVMVFHMTIDMHYN